MRKKPPVPYSQKFPHVDPFALRLLECLLAFDPKDRPSAEEVMVKRRIFYIVLSIKENLDSDNVARLSHTFMTLFSRHWVILISVVCQMWTVNHPLTQYQSLSLNLRGESWQKKMLESLFIGRCSFLHYNGSHLCEMDQLINI